MSSDMRLSVCLKKIVSSDVLSIFQMSLIKSNKSSNNGQPERSKVWQGANEKSESKQQNNLKSGKLQVTRSQSVSLFATYLVEVAGVSEPIKKRSKAKKGHSRITFDKY